MARSSARNSSRSWSRARARVVVTVAAAERAPAAPRRRLPSRTRRHSVCGDGQRWLRPAEVRHGAQMRRLCTKIEEFSVLFYCSISPARGEVKFRSRFCLCAGRGGGGTARAVVRAARARPSRSDLSGRLGACRHADCVQIIVEFPYVEFFSTRSRKCAGRGREKGCPTRRNRTAPAIRAAAAAPPRPVEERCPIFEERCPDGRSAPQPRRRVSHTTKWS